MRIGIITQPLHNNYGGILQNWALQQVLKKMGHKPYTIRIRSGVDDPLWGVRWLIHDLRWLFGRAEGFINPVDYYRGPNCAFSKFVRKNISRTRLYDNAPTRIVCDYHLDVLITGSDQVWRPMYNKHIEDQYLAFAQGQNVRRVAYAASFGALDWEYDDELEAKCRPLAQNLDAVSVREYSAVELCRQHFGVNAQWVLDPTLLLDRSDYETISLPRKISEPYIFAYILDDNEALHSQIEAEAKRRGCRLIYKLADSEVEEGDTIELWLSLIAHAELVITNSFHGTIFSLIFQRQFVTFFNNERGNARFDTLRTALPIAHRIIESGDAMPQTDVDYANVASVLERERNRSIDWLNKALRASEELEKSRSISSHS